MDLEGAAYSLFDSKPTLFLHELRGFPEAPSALMHKFSFKCTTFAKLVLQSPELFDRFLTRLGEAQRASTKEKRSMGFKR